jgi:hypothetical protein
MPDGDPTTEQLRAVQAEREGSAREQAKRLSDDEDTAQFERRADKAAYLKRKLEERDAAERELAQEDEEDDDR